MNLEKQENLEQKKENKVSNMNLDAARIIE